MKTIDFHGMSLKDALDYFYFNLDRTRMDRSEKQFEFITGKGEIKKHLIGLLESYSLDYIIPPNNDGKNDVFRPYSFPYIKCPRFVNSIDFKVFNRWGKEVYGLTSGGENSIYINWDGRTNEGAILESGVYYYKVDIEYNMNNPDLRSQTINGWVQILR